MGVKLTTKAVASVEATAKREGRQKVVWDADVRGLGVRALPSGSASWVLDYRTIEGRRRRMVLGLTSVLLLADARSVAKRTLGDVLRGLDPVEARKEVRHGATLTDLSDMYIQRHVPTKKTGAEDVRRLRKHVLPTLGKRKLTEVNRADVARLHSRIGEGSPYEANRVLALVAVMFGKAQEWGLLSETATNPAARIQPFRERSRERWAGPDELRLLWRAIEECPELHQRCAFKLYLLTGMRRNELLGLRWSHVDLKAREIRLPDTKAGRPHTIPLSDQSVGILRELPRGLGSSYVFPGRSEGRPFVNIGKSWRRVRARAWLLGNPERAEALRRRAEHEIRERKTRAKHGSDRASVVDARVLVLAEGEIGPGETLRLHDLRRTTGALMASAGTSAAIVGKVLGHTTPSATAIYARIADESKRKALEEHGARLTEIVGAAS